MAMYMERGLLGIRGFLDTARGEAVSMGSNPVCCAKAVS